MKRNYKYKKGDVICFDNGNYQLFYLITGHSEHHGSYKVLGLKNKEKVIFIDGTIDNCSNWKKVDLSKDQIKLLKI